LKDKMEVREGINKLVGLTESSEGNLLVLIKPFLKV